MINKLFLALSLFIMSQNGMTEEPSIALEKAPIRQFDKQSIQRGATFFAANCMVCHTMVFLRYNKIAHEAGITYEKMPINIKNWPLGITPPDLSLIANVRSVNWIYTYLHSFYTDLSRPYGVNNLLMHNTAMPGIIVPYQGQQILVKDLTSSKKILSRYQWYDLLELQSPGKMSAAEFDATITDLVNFLQYAAEPYEESQHSLGRWVIGFLLLFFVLAYFLKKEYWKNIHR